MHVTLSVGVVLASAGLINGAALSHLEIGFNLFRRQNQQNQQNQNQQDQGSCLDPDLIQSASDLTGQEPGTKGIKPGQAASET